jgi:hypothetical protein
VLSERPEGMGRDPVGGLATGLGGRLRQAQRPLPRAGDATGEHFSGDFWFLIF